MSFSSQYIILSLILLFNYSNCLYILPLNTSYDDWKQEKLVFKNLFYNKIFTELNIGNPTKTLPTFIKSEDYCSYILPSSSCPVETEYDSEKSSTFKSITDYDLDFKDFTDTCLANEEISLSTNIKDSKSNLKSLNFNKFYYKKKTDELPYLSGAFGFKLQNKQNEECQSFIENLGKETKDNQFTFEYFDEDENEDNARIVIGDYPHEYNKSFYSTNEYVKIFMNDSAVKTKDDFHLIFKEVYFYEDNRINSSRKIRINDESLLEASFIFEQNMFTVPIQFWNDYVSFFEKYGAMGICGMSYIDERYASIECLKDYISKADLDIHFPTIFIEHNNTNFTFEFSKDELIREYGDKMYFMIAVDTENPYRWGLGKIFMKKYLCTFNAKEKSVGIYTGFKGEDVDYSFNFFDSGIYVLLILGGNILVVLGCCMYGLISKCTKSPVDPTIMIESFSGTVDDLNKNLNGNQSKKKR